MKLHKSRSTSGKDSILTQKNQERVSAAGRRGTKKFVDPNKVFVGGIPFDSNENDLIDFFKENLGSSRNIVSIKIIRDWKTGKSKGYGFVLFCDPMFATTAMEFCKNKKLNGRILTLNQGQKKLDPNILYVKKNKKKATNEEEAAIHEGLENAEGLHLFEEEDQATLSEFDDADDSILFSSDDESEEEEFEYDGVFEELYPTLYEEMSEEELKMNRDQRREAQRRKKRLKLPAKGFQPSTE
eukprot:CAMPEP_0194204252 /NCGR_PEP_ID=MMETSP0156-20130528/3836_1 /TAXON_ID=33649 /ORGANISM="Thalassionema nitzschioides, Strain L26-B" /LENGTH=240 /DNA_ID=CAMNT_0038930227 /DNA_START=131 /DNA_END=853 /DNA_ORIENTATION=-